MKLSDIKFQLNLQGLPALCLWILVLLSAYNGAVLLIQDLTYLFR